MAALAPILRRTSETRRAPHSKLAPPNRYSFAANSSYTPDAADVGLYLRCVVTATNATGPTPQPSAAVGPVIALTAPVNTVVPVMTGNFAVGETVTTDDGTWTMTPTAYAYQWQNSPDGAAWSDIGGATANSYVVQNTDLGLYIRVKVTATNAVGSTIAYSDSSP